MATLTTEQIDRWRVVLSDGQLLLAQYLATAEGQADPELLMLSRVNTGLTDGVKLLRFIAAKRRIRELSQVRDALVAEAQALLAELQTP